jgi:hypothetical protein
MWRDQYDLLRPLETCFQLLFSQLIRLLNEN